jgi:hypothetical protein
MTRNNAETFRGRTVVLDDAQWHAPMRKACIESADRFIQTRASTLGLQGWPLVLVIGGRRFYASDSEWGPSEDDGSGARFSVRCSDKDGLSLIVENAPRQFSPDRRRWLSDEVGSWLATRPAASSPKPPQIRRARGER